MSETTGPGAQRPSPGDAVRVQCAPDLREAQYNLRAAFPHYPATLEAWREATARTRAELSPLADLEYGPAPLQRLDLYRAGGSSRPLLVYIHGGYWQAGAKTDIGFIARPYVAAGIDVAVLDYSLAPFATIERMCTEMREALGWIDRHAHRYGFDRGRIALMGHSAGGHLAAAALCAGGPPAIAWTFAISGVFDLVPLLGTSINRALALTELRADTLSPLRMRPPPGARVRTIVGELETAQFHLQAACLRRAWGDVVRAHHEVDGCDHFTVLEALADAGHAVTLALIAAILAG